MNEQMKKTFDSIGAFWGKLTKKTKVVIFICLGAAVLLAVITSAAMNRTQYTMLYSGLGSDEAQEITNELRTMSVDFKYDNGTIYVDKSKENSARMQLANKGYPKSAPNYDFFTKNVGVMTTDEERKIIGQYQLETRLGTIIKTMDAVDTAYVTITLPENSNYAWSDNKSAASASVALGLKSGKTLDAKQINGIKQLVTKSVPNLKADNVTVMDTTSGDELTASSSETSGSTQITLSEFKLKIEKQYEDNLQNKILNLLSQAYGRSNLSVSVKSKMDLDKKIQDIVTYTPSTSGGKGVVSHSTETYETTRNGSSAAGGVAGTQSNSDTTTYPGVSVNGGVITTKDSKTYDYLVSKVQEQIQSNAAALDDLTVAVVVNTDGMTDAKKQEVTALVANAAAVDQSKVAVMAAAPASSAVSQPAQPANGDLTKMLSDNKVILIAGGALLLLLILLFVLITAKRRNARREQLLANLQQTAPPPLPLTDEAGESEETEEGAEEEEGAETEEGEAPQGEEQSAEQTTKAEEETMPTESIEEIRNAADGKEQHVKNELKDFSDKNPEIAAQLIRSWLKGDDKKHG